MVQPQISALVWDVDGVFVDTENLKFLAWQELLKEKRIEYTLEEYKLVVGQSFLGILEWLEVHKGMFGTKEELKPRWLQHYDWYRGNGIPLISRNIVLFRGFDLRYPHLLKAAASSDGENVVSNLIFAGIRNLFNVVVSPKSGSGIRAKPAPDIYNLAAKLMEVEPRNCLAFEDTQTGVLAAKRAGMKCVALPNRFTVQHDFTIADYVFPPEVSLEAKKIVELFG